MKNSTKYFGLAVGP